MSAYFYIYKYTLENAFPNDWGGEFVEAQFNDVNLP